MIFKSERPRSESEHSTQGMQFSEHQFIFMNVDRILCTLSFAFAYKYRTNGDVQFNNKAPNIQR